MSASDSNNGSQRPDDLNGSAVSAMNTDSLQGKNRRPSDNHLPERYTIKTSAQERVLICLEAPNLNVHIEGNLSVSGSVARKSPGGTIFLDGVAQCAPFMDRERQVFNLDHHEGCVRAFTLASCEQALVMYMKGLDLQSREWNIFANEPDLDTILAIWIILNHGRIGSLDPTQRRILFALVRYEGIIDALGLELRELCALPPELMRKIQRVVDHLRSEEIALKKEGRWTQTDLLVYTSSILQKIDQIFYKASDFADYQGIEELARVDLTEQRIAAVVAADMGIYEIEPHLNKLYGNRLGVVFLKKDANTYTVRQMDLFMPITLDEIYERLNFVDPAVKCRTHANKWGGSDDIGGSPRETGTRLGPDDLAQTCRDAVRKLSFSQQAYRFATTSVLVSFIVLCAFIVRWHWQPAVWLDRETTAIFWNSPEFGFILILFIASGICLAFVAACQPWQYGWITPTGNQWWLIASAALVAGVTGGVWIPQNLLSSQDWIKIAIVCVVGMPLVSELLFRSLAHGLLAQNARVQRNDTRWFISWPAAGSALLYTGFQLLLMLTTAGSLQAHLWHLGLSAFAAAVFGISLAMIRERSQSLYPAVLIHMAVAATAYGIYRFVAI